MALSLVVYPDARLRQKSRPVEVFDAELEKLCREMTQVMRDHQGVGLAAIQVGVPLRVCVMDVHWDRKEPGEALVLCNPEILETQGAQKGDEGCLSVPGVFEEVERSLKVTARAQNMKGEWETHVFEDLLARCLEHEIDHMNGILFFNRLPPIRRALVEPKLKDLKKKQQASART